MAQNVRDEAEEVKRLREENERLRKRNKNLEEENKKLKEQLQRVLGSAPMLAASDRTAEAGSVPSSRTFYRRPVDQDGKKPTGGQPGHKGHARRSPEPNEPTIVLSLTECPECGGTLGDPCDSSIRIITDIPPPRVRVYELETLRYKCPHCKTRVRADPPIPKHQQFGLNVAAWIAYHRMLGLSVQKVQASLRQTFGLALSESTVLELEAWVAEVFGPRYAELQALIRTSAVVNADETKFRVGGANGWLWVFTTLLGTLYVVDPSRGRSVPLVALEGFTGTLGRDAWDPYDAVKSATFQLDLLHVNRWLERVEVQRGIEPRKLVKAQEIKFTRRGRPPREFILFADAVREILREAVLFGEKPELSAKARDRAYAKFHGRMQRLLGKTWRDKDVVRIAKELRLRLDMLFTFLRKPDVSWHNNDAERAIRQGVVHRKISGGRRTWAGARIFHTLLSVFETCKKTGEDFLALAQKLLAESVSQVQATSRGQPKT